MVLKRNIAPVAGKLLAHRPDFWQLRVREVGVRIGRKTFRGVHQPPRLPRVVKEDRQLHRRRLQIVRQRRRVADRGRDLDAPRKRRP